MNKNNYLTVLLFILVGMLVSCSAEPTVSEAPTSLEEPIQPTETSSGEEANPTEEIVKTEEVEPTEDPPPEDEQMEGEGEEPMIMELTSSAFEEGSEIPVKFTCDGGDVSPSLSWSGLPEGTQSLALIVDDPDAPVGTWVHWVLFNIPPDLTGLEEAVAGVGIEGQNDFNQTPYGGPCPPAGDPHRYFFKLYALDTLLELAEGATKDQLLDGMDGHILDQAELMGTYGR